MPASPEDLLRMYRTMVLVRQAEERLVRLFGEGRMPGFIHSYIGEEATAVGVCSALRSDDYLTSTHRGHGHVLAKGGDPARFFAELYGKESGYCRGKGGSMHVTDLDLGILGANGIVGAGIPIAAGAALASRMRGTDQVAVAFLGDGATDIGVFHEALNMASLWEVPAVFVCENNGYADFMAQSVHQKIERGTSGGGHGRARRDAQARPHHARGGGGPLAGRGRGHRDAGTAALRYRDGQDHHRGGGAVVRRAAPPYRHRLGRARGCRDRGVGAGGLTIREDRPWCRRPGSARRRSSSGSPPGTPPRRRPRPA